MPKGPKFLRFIWPIVEALRALGGSASPREVVDLVTEALEISDDERAERTPGGALRIDNQVHWARNYLVWAGLLDGSERGRWALTAEGWSIPLDGLGRPEAYELFAKVRADRKDEWGQREAADESGEDDAEVEAEPAPLDASDSAALTLESQLRTTVQGLSPTGFEHLCRRLLTELGLVQLRAVGQAGDRGIDVEGQIRVNDVVTFRVGVQCKLYAEDNKVSPRLIREFQGALGPFDRGIFMTTSVFTQAAEEQATSPGYKPIDLIDGERLLDLLQEHQLGIRTQVVVDDEFFAPFR